MFIVQENAVGYCNISVPVFINFDIGRRPSICCVLQNVNCPCLIGEVNGIASGGKHQALLSIIATRLRCNYIGKPAFTIYTVLTTIFSTRKQREKSAIRNAVYRVTSFMAWPSRRLHYEVKRYDLKCYSFTYFFLGQALSILASFFILNMVKQKSPISQLIQGPCIYSCLECQG